jgi:hypothetical protein
VPNKITRSQLINQLVEQWGEGMPFVFQKDGLSEEYEYDYGKAYMSFTCCSHGHRITLPPNEILKLHEIYGGKNPCPVCQEEATEQEDEDALPGEQITPWYNGKMKEELEKQELSPENEEVSVEDIGEVPDTPILDNDGIINEEITKTTGVLTTEEVDSLLRAVDESEEEENMDGQEEESEESEEDTDEEPEYSEEEFVDIIDKVDDRLNEIEKVFGYNPFGEISVNRFSQKGEVDITTTCRLCDKEVNFKSIDEFGSVIELAGKNGIELFKFHNCPHCIESMQNSVDNEGKKNYRNILFMNRVNKALKEIGVTLINIKGKSNYRSPFDEIGYKDESGDRHNAYIYELLSDFDEISKEKKEKIAEKISSEEERKEIDKSINEITDNIITETNNAFNKEATVEVTIEDLNEANKAVTSEENIEISLENEDSDQSSSDESFSNGLFKNMFSYNKNSLPIVIDLANDESSSKESISIYNNNKEEEKKEEIKVEEIQEKENSVNKETITLDLGLGKSSPGNEKSAKENIPDAVKLRTNSRHQDLLEPHIIEERQSKEGKWWESRVFLSPEDAQINEFVDEESLFANFWESEMGKCIKMVADITDATYSLKIDEETWELPLVDFNTGVRVMCIDVDDETQLKVPTDLETSVKFGFDLPKGRFYKKVFLYSDSVKANKYRFKATVKALVKIINCETFDPRRIVKLEDNYALFYIDSKPIIKEFEMHNSTYVSGKPMTQQLGLVAMRNTIEKQKKFTSKDILNYLQQSETFDLKNFNMYMIGSVRYIEMVDQQSQAVEYLVTDYTELGASIILDGFEHLLGAIIKCHYNKYPAFSYTITYEFDPSSMPSPSLETFYDKNDFIPLGSYPDDMGCYMRKIQYRFNSEDNARQDSRMFTISTLSKRFAHEIQNSGFDIRYAQQRNKFIDQLGFTKCFQPKVKKYMIDPIRCFNIQWKKSITMMQYIDLSRFFSGSGVYDGGYDKILMQKMLINLSQMSKNNESLDNNENTEQVSQLVQMMMLSKMIK